MRYAFAYAYSLDDMTPVRPPRTFGFWLPNDVPLRFGDIEICQLSDNHKEVVEHGETWVPRSFTARFDRTALPRFELDIALVDGRFRCVELRVLRRGDEDYIETNHLRKIPIVDLVREAVELVTYVRVELTEQEDVDLARWVFEEFADLEAYPVELDDMQIGDFFRYPTVIRWIADDPEKYETEIRPLTGYLLREAEPRTRRGSITDEEVADAYRAAYERNQPVTDSIATRFTWARQTARNRIRRARKAGLLPPTEPGSARV
jgi:hypothetical protein